VEDQAEWDRDARPHNWLGPHELVVWRGRPDRRVVFARQDKYLFPLTIVWCVVVLSILLSLEETSDLFSKFVVAIFVVAGMYLTVGRFVTKRRTRRHLRYAVTNERALEIVNGRVTHSTPLKANYKVQRLRDGRRGSILWRVDPLYFRGGAFSNLQSLSLLEGTGFPGAEAARTRVVFFDVDNLDGALSALGPSIERNSIGAAETSSTARSREVAGATIRVGPVRRWFQLRFGSKAYSLAISLPAAEVLNRIATQVKPMYSVGFSLSKRGVRGRVNGSHVTLLGYVRGNNSWNLQFSGSVSDATNGAVLDGSIDTLPFVRFFSVIWCAPFMISLVVMVGIFLTHVVTGHLDTHFLKSVPFALIPVGFLAFFGVVTEIGSRVALQGWSITDEWLRDLLANEGPTNEVEKTQPPN
jgi:hypothetical protein